MASGIAFVPKLIFQLEGGNPPLGLGLMGPKPYFQPTLMYMFPHRRLICPIEHWPFRTGFFFFALCSVTSLNSTSRLTAQLRWAKKDRPSRPLLWHFKDSARKFYPSSLLGLQRLCFAFHIHYPTYLRQSSRPVHLRDHPAARKKNLSFFTSALLLA